MMLRYVSTPDPGAPSIPRYTAALVPAAGDDESRAEETVTIATIEKGNWERRSDVRWEIDWADAARTTAYTDTLGEAKALIEQCLLEVVAAALASRPMLRGRR